MLAVSNPKALAASSPIQRPASPLAGILAADGAQFPNASRFEGHDFDDSGVDGQTVILRRSNGILAAFLHSEDACGISIKVLPSSTGESLPFL